MAAPTVTSTNDSAYCKRGIRVTPPLISGRRPSDAAIAEFLDRQRNAPFSYAEVGASRGDPPAGYAIDRHTVGLGAGQSAFRRAREAIDRWAMFECDWVEIHPPGCPVSQGVNVAILARVLGLWYLNACRIVHLIDEAGPIEHYGFAYGTLPDHAGQGEEHFSVLWDRADDSVRYEQFAFSRPSNLLTRINYPLARTVQKRFAKDAIAAMVRAVQ